MAQPSNVQREPSMEEILASIRRIIEDNETSRKDDKVVPQPGSYRSSPNVVEDSHDDELQPQAAEMRAPQETPSRGEPELASPVVNEPIVAEVPVIESSKTGSIQPEVAQSEPVVLAEPMVHAEPVIHTEEAVSTSPDLDIPTPGIPESIVSNLSTPILNIVEQHVSDLIAASDDEEPTSPIVSEQSGRKVAASFGELSDAYQANRRKSLADAAEEMLRPMLREWLDDNLPQLVEKLVREEIERIARGS